VRAVSAAVIVVAPVKVDSGERGKSEFRVETVVPVKPGRGHSVHKGSAPHANRESGRRASKESAHHASHANRESGRRASKESASHANRGSEAYDLSSLERLQHLKQPLRRRQPFQPHRQRQNSQRLLSDQSRKRQQR
jgi:hypothetical protein